MGGIFRLPRHQGFPAVCANSMKRRVCAFPELELQWYRGILWNHEKCRICQKCSRPWSFPATFSNFDKIMRTKIKYCERHRTTKKSPSAKSAKSALGWEFRVWGGVKLAKTNWLKTQNHSPDSTIWTGFFSTGWKKNDMPYWVTIKYFPRREFLWDKH